MKKSDGLLREAPAVRFAFIQQHAEKFPVDVMCEVLDVSRSGYYAWRDRPASGQAQRREQLVEIHKAHVESRKNCGSPRIHRELRDQGIVCPENSIAKLMKNHGIRSKMHRRFVVQTTDSRHGHPIAENRLNQQFHVPAPNQVWAADITYIPTGGDFIASVQLNPLPDTSVRLPR